MIQALPDRTRSLYQQAFTAALHPVFLYAAVIGVFGFVLTWFLKEVPLRGPVRRGKRPSGDADRPESTVGTKSPGR
jgi:hypothetical protein